jgi:hypothetical protein
VASVESFLLDQRAAQAEAGDNTLQQTDRAGATLDIVSPLANPMSHLMFSPGVGNAP